MSARVEGRRKGGQMDCSFSELPGPLPVVVVVMLTTVLILGFCFKFVLSHEILAFIVNFESMGKPPSGKSCDKFPNIWM